MQHGGACLVLQDQVLAAMLSLSPRASRACASACAPLCVAIPAPLERIEAPGLSSRQAAQIPSSTDPGTLNAWRRASAWMVAGVPRERGRPKRTLALAPELAWVVGPRGDGEISQEISPSPLGM